jgi:hypothetical protein
MPKGKQAGYACGGNRGFDDRQRQVGSTEGRSSSGFLLTLAGPTSGFRDRSRLSMRVVELIEPSIGVGLGRNLRPTLPLNAEEWWNG